MCDFLPSNYVKYLYDTSHDKYNYLICSEVFLLVCYIASAFYAIDTECDLSQYFLHGPIFINMVSILHQVLIVVSDSHDQYLIGLILKIVMLIITTVNVLYNAQCHDVVPSSFWSLIIWLIWSWIGVPIGLYAYRYLRAMVRFDILTFDA